jgi:hypothetical protein
MTHRSTIQLAVHGPETFDPFDLAVPRGLQPPRGRRRRHMPREFDMQCQQRGGSGQP